METTGALSWRTSSYSTSNGGDCIEVGAAPRAVAVRDSKDPDGPVLAGLHPPREDGHGAPPTRLTGGLARARRRPVADAAFRGYSTAVMPPST